MTPGRRTGARLPETIVPEARGKAEAYDSWAAMSGRINEKTGKYQSGPLSGKTYAQAMQQFDRMWRSSPDSIKEKYASRSANRPYTDLAPSERLIQGITPAMQSNLGQQGNRMKQLEDQKISRIRMYGGDAGVAEYQKNKTSATPAYDKDRNGVPDMIQRPAEPKQASQVANPRSTALVDSDPRANPRSTAGAGYGTAIKRETGDQSATAMGTPDEQAKVAAMMKEGEGYATAFFAPPGSARTEGLQDLGMRAAAANAERIKRMENPALAPVWDEKKKADEAAAVRESASKIAEGQNQMVRAQNAERARLGLPNPPPGNMPAQGTPVTSGMATDERMHAQGKTNVGGVPINKAPPAATTPSNQVTVAKPARINSLTGLPFGYRPGDDVPAANKAAADASVGRQIAADPRMQAGGGIVQGPAQAAPTGTVMTPTPRTVANPVRPPTALASSGINRPRTLPPGTNTIEGRAADELRRQAAINRNPGTVNPDDPKKFFTGRVKPLTELVAPRIGPTPERPSVGLPGSQSAPNRTVATPMRDANTRADAAATRLDYGRPAPKQLVTSITRPQFAMARR